MSIEQLLVGLGVIDSRAIPGSADTDGCFDIASFIYSITADAILLLLVLLLISFLIIYNP